MELFRLALSIVQNPGYTPPVNVNGQIVTEPALEFLEDTQAVDPPQDVQLMHLNDSLEDFAQVPPALLPPTPITRAVHDDQLSDVSVLILGEDAVTPEKKDGDNQGGGVGNAFRRLAAKITKQARKVKKACGSQCVDLD